MNITDPKLRLLLLAELVRDPVGLTPSQALALRALSSEELVRLANMEEPRLTLTLDDSIEIGLRRAEAMAQQDADLDYLIAHGARYSMVAAFRRLSRADFSKLRRKFPGTKSVGRPTIPGGPLSEMPGPEGERVKEQMQAWWWERTKDRPATVSDYIAMHQAFPTWSLATLGAVTRSCGGRRGAMRPARPAATVAFG
jgi:Protein of unknown function (DUF2857)